MSMIPAMLRRGRYQARFAETPQDLQAAQALRHRCFVGANEAALNGDGFDTRCQHVLVEEVKTGRLVCGFRLLPLLSGAEIHTSYSAQYYDLSALSRFEGAMVEMGRFCTDPEVLDPDVLRVGWGAVTRFVDLNHVEMLFGCSSFEGTEAAAHLDAFDVLAQKYLAPGSWVPRVKAEKVFTFTGRDGDDPKAGLKRMPPLLRSYLAMGGWVSDHAVVDEPMNTLHVFTGLEIKTIPAARVRALRAVAG